MTRAIVVLIDGERRWIDAAQVQAAMPLDGLTPVPGAPLAVRGLTQRGGEILPVVAASARPGEARPGDPLLLVEWREQPVAILVDQVLGLRDRPEGRPLDLDRLLDDLRRRLG